MLLKLYEIMPVLEIRLFLVNKLETNGLITVNIYVNKKLEKIMRWFSICYCNGFDV